MTLMLPVRVFRRFQDPRWASQRLFQYFGESYSRTSSIPSGIAALVMSPLDAPGSHLGPSGTSWFRMESRAPMRRNCSLDRPAPSKI